jgi:hypothetical protein
MHTSYIILHLFFFTYHRLVKKQREYKHISMGSMHLFLYETRGVTPYENHASPRSTS